MQGRVVAVTGAASGIGRATVERMTKAGWIVAAIDLPGPELDSLATDLGATVYTCDVADDGQVVATAARIIEQLGGIDRLVHSAGIAVRGRIDELPPEEFARMMNINYLGTVRWVRAVLPSMQERGAGELVLLASIAGWMPTPAMAAYTSTKFAVIGFADTLAMELHGSGVTLRCVCPTVVATPMLDDILDQSSARIRQRTRGVSPVLVVGAIESSLRRRRPYRYVFPGVSSKILWRLRRFAPRLLAALAARLAS